MAVVGGRELRPPDAKSERKKSDGQCGQQVVSVRITHQGRLRGSDGRGVRVELTGHRSSGRLTIAGHSDEESNTTCVTRR